MNSREVIKKALANGPKTTLELAEVTDLTLSMVRNTCSVLYFEEQVIGCDVRGRHHLLDHTNGNTPTNGAIIRFLGGVDVVA